MLIQAPAMNQRWRDGRDSYRPRGEIINTAEYEVAPVVYAQAKQFVIQHHYSGKFGSSVSPFGLYRRGQLVGAAVFGTPMTDTVVTNVFPGNPRDALELNRFVLLDEVPGNGETWFLARCFAQLRKDGLRGVVSFSDPVPRRSAAGDVVFPGHIGTIYQAHNGVYMGRGTARTIRILPNGHVVCDRALSKIRTRDQGWEYATRQLVQYGAAEPAPGEDLKEWLRLWLPRVTRSIRHPGNHKYAWRLQPRVVMSLPTIRKPYPKGLDLAS